MTWAAALGRIVENRTIPVELIDESEIRFPLHLRRALAIRLDDRLSTAEIKASAVPSTARAAEPIIWQNFFSSSDITWQLIGEEDWRSQWRFDRER